MILRYIIVRLNLNPKVFLVQLQSLTRGPWCLDLVAGMSIEPLHWHYN